MSEYVKVEPEPTDDPDVMELYVNQTLTSGAEEIYETPDDGEMGSPIAQMLFDGIDGINSLIIREDCLVVTRDPKIPWEDIIDEIRDALRDFFL